MKKCNSCGKLVNEYWDDCPHCRTGFGEHYSGVGGDSGAAVLTETAVAVEVEPEAGPVTGVRPVAEEPEVNYTDLAGFWIRFGAFLIDYIIVVLPLFFFGFVSGLASVPQAAQGQDPSGMSIALMLTGYLAVFVLWCANNIYLQGTYGWTLGKRLCRLSVVRASGEPLGIGRVILRELFKGTISAWVCYLGFLLQAADRDGQAWHDKVAGSYVYYT